MPITSKYLFVVSMDVDSDKEALFNEVYDVEHVPTLLKVPGVKAVSRMAGEPFTVSLGGEERRIAHEGPRYSALYEIDDPKVSGERRLGEGGGRGALADPCPAFHPQSPARALQGPVGPPPGRLRRLHPCKSSVA